MPAFGRGVFQRSRVRRVVRFRSVVPALALCVVRWRFGIVCQYSALCGAMSCLSTEFQHTSIN
eukprot:1886995-Alexandrium_andersonii.AAC.1